MTRRMSDEEIAKEKAKRAKDLKRLHASADATDATAGRPSLFGPLVKLISNFIEEHGNWAGEGRTNAYTPYHLAEDIGAVMGGFIAGNGGSDEAQGLLLTATITAIAEATGFDVSREELTPEEYAERQALKAAERGDTKH